MVDGYVLQRGFRGGGGKDGDGDVGIGIGISIGYWHA